MPYSSSVISRDSTKCRSDGKRLSVRTEMLDQPMADCTDYVPAVQKTREKSDARTWRELQRAIASRTGRISSPEEWPLAGSRKVGTIRKRSNSPGSVAATVIIILSGHEMQLNCSHL